MLIDRSQRKWWFSCIGVILVAFVAYLLWQRGAPERPIGNTTLGLTFGISAYALILFDGLLCVRKGLPGWRIGRLQTWMSAHVWLGLLAAGLVCLHTGLRRGGFLTTTMLVMFTIVVGSGIFGALMQHFAPRSMTSEIPLETVYEQIERVRAQLVEEADTLMQEAFAKPAPQPKPPAAAVGAPVTSVIVAQGVEDPGKNLLSFYKSELRPFLTRSRSSKGRLAQVPAAEAVFRQLKTLLPPNLHPAVDDLENICDEKRQLDRQRTMHHWLHCWMLIHGPLSLTLLVVIAAHAFMVLRY